MLTDGNIDAKASSNLRYGIRRRRRALPVGVFHLSKIVESIFGLDKDRCGPRPPGMKRLANADVHLSTGRLRLMDTRRPECTSRDSTSSRSRRGSRSRPLNHPAAGRHSGRRSGKGRWCRTRLACTSGRHRRCRLDRLRMRSRSYRSSESRCGCWCRPFRYQLRSIILGPPPSAGTHRMAGKSPPRTHQKKGTCCQPGRSCCCHPGGRRSCR